MKTISFSLMLLFLITGFSCEKDIKNPSLDEFCSVKPEGWNCEILTENFDLKNIPVNAPHPLAIIKYENPNLQFQTFGNIKLNPSLVLDFYSIKQKDKLLEIIRSQIMYSWCIPTYYGETKDYFILTSPCFINGGNFSEEANASISELQQAIKNIIIVRDYDIP